MCGIVGCVAEEPVAGILLDGLKRVEYRGYDSAGMATVGGESLRVRKGVGRVKDIEGRVGLSQMEGKTGMAHTRWATHGGVTDANAHPHVSCRGQVAVIHNGIIENYIPLKKALAAKGHRFKSETDTEVIAHIIEDEYRRVRDPLKATLAATRRLKGQYAVVVMFQDRPDVMVGARKDAPLIVGVGDGKMFLASDVLAFIGHTDRTIFLDNHEVALLTRDRVKIVGPSGREVKRKPTQVAW
jgi:glucosamine--fructose-6-phosphate aminotransferase (isomerizing)